MSCTQTFTRNILIDADDRISVLDFGLGRILDPGSPHDHAQRAGFSWNTEPEAAASFAVSGSVDAASTAGEQFSIASVVYTLICGEHYSGAAPTRDDLLKKVMESRPLPFARHGFESWPEVEEVLTRALSRDPADRYASTDAFSAAFRQTSPGRAVARLRTERRNRKLLEQLLRRVGQPARGLDQAYRRASIVSTHYGASGLAYFLYRASLITEAPRWIAAADQWSRLALAGLNRHYAFESVDVGVTTDRPSLGSLYYRRSGIHLVHALISNARGDRRAAEEQADAFSAVLEDDGPTELLLGRSGVLLGATLLLESAPSQPGDVTEDRTRKLARAVDRARCDAAFERIASRTPRHLGIAHGDAGVVYAQLRARAVLGMPIPTGVYDCLRDLAARAEPSGRGCSWPGTLGGLSAAPATPGHAPGWCAGSAGHVHLWLLAHRITNDASFLSIAERAAWHCWEHDDRTGHLCCGLAGRAFALLELYKHTGEAAWLERAATLVDRSHAWVDAELRAGDRPLSLFWGALGPLLAELELERPELAAMPLFASEGWPT
jgi:serine/threonine-protein kinase